ncbi:MAG: DnaD domain protein [Thermincola sp.]|jgi:DNA replication protein|nr:DnaD domain protein [Thermincola sp.]MDT3703584.1 DnaD domain protein [Thermincola sp.]
MGLNGDKKGNITSSFGSDIILEGMTGVPNLLLKYYSKLGITDYEMMLIIQLMHIQTAANQPCPSYESLAEYMSGDAAKIRADLASLIEKGIISINHVYCESTDEVVAVYSYEPLFEKILELWACEKVKAYQMMRKNLKEQIQKTRANGSKNKQPYFAVVCQAFEKEFGRLLSPMEMEQVNVWLDDGDGRPELIMEALKRAVMLGKHNFKYIDSILLEWNRNKLTTVSEISAYETKFRERQMARPLKRKPENTENKKDKYRLLYLS